MLLATGPPKMPDEPIRVIRVTRNMLAIHWTPPFDDGGYPIERYIVEKREASRGHWTQVGVCSPDVTAFCVTDLAEDQVYYFRIIAETAFGCSEPLELDKPIVPRRIFGMLRSNIYINQSIKYYFIARPKSDQTAAQLCLPHTGITKTEKNRTKT